MLIFEREQFRKFAKVETERFDQTVSEFFAVQYPEQLRIFGKEKIHKLVAHSIMAARRYDILSKRGIASYANTAFLLGACFDQDVRLPWAKEILQMDAHGPLRARLLEERASLYCLEVFGEDGAPWLEALSCVHLKSYESLTASLREEPRRAILEQWQSLFPSLYATLDEASKTSLFEFSVHLCREIDINAPRNQKVIAAISFLLGNRFYEDHRFCDAWAILSDATANETDRTRAFFDYMRALFDQMLREFGHLEAV